LRAGILLPGAAPGVMPGHHGAIEVERTGDRSTKVGAGDTAIELPDRLSESTGVLLAAYGKRKRFAYGFGRLHDVHEAVGAHHR
jgi:hypothetical protein